MSNSSTGTVLLTDRAWPDDTVERAVVEAAGLRLVAGPPEPAPAATIEDLIGRYRPDAVLTCWALVSGQAVAASPRLRVVARMGVGLDNIDVQAATDRGVVVTNVPDYCVDEVSDHAVAMVLGWARGLVTADRATRRGLWDPAGMSMRRVSALTCGVAGLGRIGQATARKLRALGATVIASDPRPPADTGGVPVLALEEVLRRSDVLVLHVPVTPATHHLIGERELALMPAGGLLVNVSRGGLVDTPALVAALRSGRLSGAALDVLESEPEIPAELLDQPGVVITPHIAFSSDASLIELRRSAAEEAVRVLRGEPARHPCNQPVSGFVGRGAPQ